MRPVGILGGMGPEATVLLMQKLLSAVPARDDADHVPVIVHQNPQVPSRIAALIEGTGEDPAPTLARMARDLRAAGAEALAMPCNTAHHFTPAIEAATDLPFLSMIDLTAEALKNQGVRRVGMLASPATRRVGVFDGAFRAHELEPVWREEEGLLQVIRAVKAGVGEAETGPSLQLEAQALMAAGTDHLLVACTELSLLTHHLPGGLAYTDSLDCLVSAIARFARGAQA